MHRLREGIPALSGRGGSQQWQFSLKVRHNPSGHGASIPKGQNLFHLVSPQGLTASFYGQGLEVAYQPAKGPLPSPRD